MRLEPSDFTQLEQLSPRYDGHIFHPIVSIGVCEEQSCKDEMLRALDELVEEKTVCKDRDDVALRGFWEPKYDLVDAMNCDIERRVSQLGNAFQFRFHPEHGYGLFKGHFESGQLEFLSVGPLEIIYRYLRQNYSETDYDFQLD
ncbi:MAG: hypothetical protein QM780_05145 [Hyphomicrobium sp.]|uniref:hypothetical protein n=1 Tax=Hyphomicrobium sp. TaxID=82 RepID=UPI0039E705DC